MESRGLSRPAARAQPRPARLGSAIARVLGWSIMLAATAFITLALVFVFAGDREVELWGALGVGLAALFFGAWLATKDRG